jgi:hypothetical protein
LRRTTRFVRSLPDHHYQAPARQHGPGNVTERNDRFAEKHCSEPAPSDIKVFRREAVRRSIRLFKSHIPQSLGFGSLACSRDRSLRNINFDCVARYGKPRRLARRLSSSAPDVQDTIIATDAACLTQHDIASLEFGIVIDKTDRPIITRADGGSACFHVSRSLGSYFKLLSEVQARNAISQVPDSRSTTSLSRFG